MEWIISIWEFVFETLLSELVVVIAGVLIVQKAQKWLDKKRYGGWRVIVTCNDESILERDISYTKLKAIQEEPAELSVYLKGVISPYSWIVVDIIEKGEELELVITNTKNKTYTINLDKNPQEKEKPCSHP